MSVGFVLAEIPPVEDAAPRNAAGEPFYQWKLKEYVKALKEAYGWRDDYDAPNHKAIPWLPLPFAEAMLRYFRVQAKHFLGKSIPDAAKQPTYIRRHVDETTAILGTVVGGQLVPNPEHFEQAPPHVASKAPSYYKPEFPEGQPHPLVLKAPETYRFLHGLSALAIHFDALDGTPTKVDILVESVKESIEELPGRVLDTVVAIPGTLKSAASAGKEILSTVAVVGVGLVALFFLTRK